jgi:hypothetical protein
MYEQTVGLGDAERGKGGGELSSLELSRNLLSRWRTATQDALRGSRIRGGHPNDGLSRFGVSKYYFAYSAASAPNLPTFFSPQHLLARHETNWQGRRKANKEAKVKQEGRAAECTSGMYSSGLIGGQDLASLNQTAGNVIISTYNS